MTQPANLLSSAVVQHLQAVPLCYLVLFAGVGIEHGLKMLAVLVICHALAEHQHLSHIFRQDRIKSSCCQPAKLLLTLRSRTRLDKRHQLPITYFILDAQRHLLYAGVVWGRYLVWGH